MEGLLAEDVVVRFGGLVALAGVGLEAPPARITGLIGPNGAGKTTMFNVCCGLQSASAGRVILDSVDISHESAPRRARLGIGRTFQRMELFRSLTVQENIELAAESLHIGSGPFSQLGIIGGGLKVRSQIRQVTEELLAVTGLEAVAGRLAGEISTGQGRLVELARALARRPRLLLLDEPSSGLDAAESLAFGELLVRLVAERGLGILMIEHDINLVLKVCEWIYVIDFGRPLMAGTPEDVRNDPQVRAAYLGQAA